MNRRTEKTLRFLASHQPMPPDDALGENVIRQFERARRYFIAHPDARCLPLFLRALPANDSSGFGVYQLLDDVLRAHDPVAVTDALVEALSGGVSAPAWVLELAGDYDDVRLLQLAGDFKDSHDEEERLWAHSYLETYGDQEERVAARSYLELYDHSPFRK